MYLPPPTEGDFELTPAGTHLAVCYRVIDLGTQNTTYNGQPKFAHKILVSWELPDEHMKDGRPFTISQRYTWSMSEKATLRKHLESWRGAAFTEADFGPNGFNIKNILGKGCVLTVTHSEKGEKHYANIAGIGKLMKGMAAPTPKNETVYLWLNPGLFSPELFHKLSQGLQTTIMQSPEYLEVTGAKDSYPEPPPHEARDEMDMDIPF
jgi:hypothetical protein